VQKSNLMFQSETAQCLQTRWRAYRTFDQISVDKAKILNRIFFVLLSWTQFFTDIYKTFNTQCN